MSDRGLSSRQSVRETDCEFLLRILSDGQPHNLNEILRRSLADRGCGLTVHSRAANLRDPRHGGHNIRNWKNGQRGDGSWYQLLESTSACEGPADVDSSGDRTLLGPLEDDPRTVAAPIPGQLCIEVAA